MNIKFTEEEVKELRTLAHTRNTKAEGVVGRDLGVPSSISHFYGTFTEAAVAKAFGVTMNKTHYPKGGDKHQPDLTIDKVGKIEVKSVTEKYKHDPWLKVEVRTFNKEIDYYVLTTTTMANNEVQIVGYATRAMVEAATQRRTRPDFPLNYELKADQLLDFQDLINLSKGIVEPTKKEAKEQVIYEAKPRKTKQEIEVGDMVSSEILNSPVMVINSMNGNLAHCVYFNKKKELIALDIPVNSLSKVSK